MAITVTRTRKSLVIEIPFQRKPTPVRGVYGKALQIATTQGAVPTHVRYKGNIVVIDVNALIYPGDESEYKVRAHLSMARTERKIKPMPEKQG